MTQRYVEKLASSRKEANHNDFRLAKVASELMIETVRIMNTVPKKFRHTYADHISKHAIMIYESINKVNYLKDVDLDGAKRIVQDVDISLMLLQEEIDILRVEQGITLNQLFVIMNKMKQFIPMYRSWSTKYIVNIIN